MITFRRFLLVVFYFWCVCTILMALLFVAAFYLDAFDGLAGSSEFIDMPGPTAKRLIQEWPPGLSATKVQRVSSKYDYTIDSHSTWYKIDLDAESAKSWINAVHAQLEHSSFQSVRPDDRGLEAVRRTITSPPPLHCATGETPNWWKPPSIEYQATEVMKWYSGYGSGVGQAAYTGYDRETQQLWIYEYACQHDRLWEPHHIPEGDILSRLGDAESSEATKPH